jgi:ATPase subunit of ABC transporter with duplicated ATPase domains
MSLITLSNLGKDYGTQTVLKAVSVRVGRGEKIGVVGKNGGGKTTLLRLILGQEYPDTGSITITRGIRVGYLAQVNRLDTDATVLAEARTVLSEVEAVESELREAEEYLAANPEDEDALDSYAVAKDRFDFAGGDAAEQNLLAALAAMGFSEADFEKSVSVLSGGERTRLAMAKLLASAPDILLLDEPTNHLDIRAVEWLEAFLSRFPGAVLLVSHDRRFLQNVAQIIWEVEAAGVNTYKGGFAAYRMQRAANRARQAEEYTRQQQYIARTEEFYSPQHRRTEHADGARATQDPQPHRAA